MRTTDRPPETVRLAKQAVASTRGRRFDHAIAAYLEQAAARQDQVHGRSELVGSAEFSLSPL